MSKQLLIIDDDERLCSMLDQYLSQAGYRVTCCHTVGDGLREQRRLSPDAIILDLMLPDGDGLDVCTKLRETTAVPIIMLTARGDATDRIVGLELGADDYLPKPFDPRELLARLRTVLRRGGAVVSPVLRFGRLEIDRESRQVRIDGQVRALTGYQFDLLVTLAERAGRVVTRNQLLELVSGRALDAFDRSIDVHISSIRAAIEDNPRQPRRILTLRGAGYLFTRTQDESA
ncbi:response regulator [Lysobacter tyrosinilyticus]